MIIGRTAGEDKDASDTKGSYQLTDVEEDLLTKVRKNFDKMIVLLNVGLLDMSFTDRYQPEAVMYVWQRRHGRRTWNGRCINRSCFTIRSSDRHDRI